MENKKIKGVSHPMDGYNFFIEMCTDTITNTLEQFSLPFHNIAKEQVKDWNNLFMNPFTGYSLLPMNWPDPSREKISQLKNEAGIHRNRIEQLETELNEKSILSKKQVKLIADLKSELSCKKREVTLKAKKIETLSRQLLDQQKKVVAESKRTKQLPKKTGPRQA